AAKSCFHDQAETHDADVLALDPENMTWQQLQRVERRQEIPLGSDAWRHRRKRISLLPKFPRVEQRERGEDGERDVPREHIAEDVVGEERHLPDALAGL